MQSTSADGAAEHSLLGQSRLNVSSRLSPESQKDFVASWTIEIGRWTSVFVESLPLKIPRIRHPVATLWVIPSDLGGGYGEQLESLMASFDDADQSSAHRSLVDRIFSQDFALSLRSKSAGIGAGMDCANRARKQFKSQ